MSIGRTILFSFFIAKNLVASRFQFPFLIIEGERREMRKGNGTSAAYYADITRQTRIEERDYNVQNVKELPKIGSIIIVNEVVQEAAYIHFHPLRGCFQVVSLTKKGLYVCQKLYSQEIQYTTCLRKMDFLRGIYIFKEIPQPLYEKENSWAAYDLKNLEVV